MIKIFSKIRQNLLTENPSARTGRTGETGLPGEASAKAGKPALRIGRYFQYAIGEIVLVMVGILLALQVNNWNQERKNRIIENDLYHSLVVSLESDLEDVTDKIGTVKSALKAQDIFMKNSFSELKTKFDIPQIEQLLIELGRSSRSFFPNYGFYNKISNNNQIDLIQSDKLQIKIIELYEQFYKRYNDLDLNIEHQSIFSLSTNFYSKIRHLAHEDGWNDLTFDILEKHYPILQDETRKINGLTSAPYNSMLNCKGKIELLLQDLEQELEK